MSEEFDIIKEVDKMFAVMTKEEIAKEWIEGGYSQYGKEIVDPIINSSELVINAQNVEIARLKNLVEVYKQTSKIQNVKYLTIKNRTSALLKSIKTILEDEDITMYDKLEMIGKFRI